MDITSLITFLIIGIVAGWLAGVIMKGGGYGLLGDLILGVIGAMVGGHLLPLIGVELCGTLGSIFTATIGAIVLIALVRLIKRV